MVDVVSAGRGVGLGSLGPVGGEGEPAGSGGKDAQGRPV